MMKLHPLWTTALLLLGLLTGCYPPRMEPSPSSTSPQRVDVQVKGDKVDVDATADPAPQRPVRRAVEGKKVEVDVLPGGGVDVEVKPKR